MTSYKKIYSEEVSILLAEQNVWHSLKLADQGYVLESEKIIMPGEGKELLGYEQIKKAHLAA